MCGPAATPFIPPTTFTPATRSLQANEILHHKLTLNGYLAQFTGQSMETITMVGGGPSRQPEALQPPHLPATDLGAGGRGCAMALCHRLCASLDPGPLITSQLARGHTRVHSTRRPPLPLP